MACGVPDISQDQYSPVFERQLEIHDQILIGKGIGGNQQGP